MTDQQGVGPGARPSYWDYIRVEELLSLQSGLGASDADLTDDEVRFIVIHQIDELWFKLGLRELSAARDVFRPARVAETDLASAVAALRRVALIFRLATHHFELMETMRTQQYLRFRDKLAPASGFQSAQMRELEILLGLEDDQRIPFGHESSYVDALRGSSGDDSPAFRRVQARRADRPTLKEAIYAWLYRTPIDASSPDDDGDDSAVARFLDDFLARHRDGQQVRMQQWIGSQAIGAEDRARLEQRFEAELEQAARYLQADDADASDRPKVRRMRAAILFIDLNRQLPLLAWPAEIIDALAETEQSMLVFRQRHARMVERVIGRRVGTGGSDGVAYLDKTALEYRVFREIWAARTLLLPPELSPPVGEPSFYGYAAP